MPMVPAFCDSCGFAFPSGVFVENCVNITLSGNKVGPCPKCGSMGSVIDGVFDATRNLIEIVSAPDWTKQKLKGLEVTLKKIQELDASPEEKVDVLKREAPELSSIAETLPRTRVELYAFLTMLLFAISIFISECSVDEKDKITDKPGLQYVVDKAAEEVQKI
jgi:hypothetical protein